MGNKLSSINKNTIFDQNVTFSIKSEKQDIGSAEGGYAVQVVLTNDSAADMDFTIEASLDGITYSPISTTTTKLVSGGDLDIIWDVGNTSVEFIKIDIVVNTGSADVKIMYSSKARH